jgi:hypothetical protein
LARRWPGKDTRVIESGTTQWQSDDVVVNDPTALDFFFLQRLALFVERQDAAKSEWERALLAQAAFSTYLDCLDLSLGEAAERILTRDPLTLLLWRPGEPV